jgi:hypothetical protein
MARPSTQFAIALATAGFLISAGAAHAICAIPVAGYAGGAYGAEAVTAGGCFVGVDTEGGAGVTTASASSTTTDISGTIYSLASSADLASGVLTAYTAVGIASASIWDTFTYSGLPAAGATVTATLSLSGSFTGASFGNAELEAGLETDFPDNAATQDAFTSGGSIPASVTLSFNVENGTPETVLAEIFVHGLSGVGNFGDPPTLTLSLPAGASVTTASGVFVDFTAAPEPSTWGMLILSIAGLGFAGHRRRMSC